jgi:hypothetical protein
MRPVYGVTVAYLTSYIIFAYMMKLVPKLSEDL